jgi:phage terminase large subunit
MTFVLCAYMLHAWLFVPGFAGAIGSRKQDLVDKHGDPKTIFWKIRYMLERLPGWMLPRGFTRREHDNFLRLINPQTGATITGEAGDEMGRGGRASLYFIDEWAFVERAESVNAAVSQNSNVIIKGSTPNGIGNLMYQERFSGKYPVFTLHWRDNPDKTGAWYEAQKLKLDPVTLAQEIDIDYTASAEGIMIPGAWVRAAISFPLAQGAVRASGLDVTADGKDFTVYAHRRGPVVTRLERIASAETQRPSDVEDLARADGTQTLFYDRLGVGSGVTTTLKKREADLPFKVVGVANNDAVTDRIFEDQPGVRAVERFANYAAELWWALRLRFKATYERAEGIAEHPDEDCISIPNIPELIMQLSQPTYVKNSKDKIQVNKYGNGTKSPDYAEAVLYAFASERPQPERRLTW